MNVEPVEEFLGAVFANRLFELSRSRSGFQAQCNLRAGIGVRHVPALRLAPGLAHAARLLVVGMDLHRKFFVRKEKLCQQRESLCISRRITNKIALALLT